MIYNLMNCIDRLLYFQVKLFVQLIVMNDFIKLNKFKDCYFVINQKKIEKGRKLSVLVVYFGILLDD